MNNTLKSLLEKNPTIWSGRQTELKSRHGLPTGFALLDDILPTHGWPENTLIEISLPHWGIGELQLLLPTLVSVSQENQWIAWLSPPFTPYAPALADAGVCLEQMIVIPEEESKNESLWAMEKILRNQSCGIAMSWPKQINDKAMRRLKIAAQEGKSLGFVFRDRQTASSPAALRISLTMVKHQLKVTLLKAQGTSHYRSVLLDLPIISGE